MGKLSIPTAIMVLAFVTLNTTSCQDAKKENNNEDGQHYDQVNENGTMSSQIILEYLVLKDALVDDNRDAAEKAGERLMIALENFDKSKFKEDQRTAVIDIIEDATEHVEHIAKSDLDHQREHFDILSNDMIDLIAITGTEKTLYQDFCPMYNNNKGGQWLSAAKEIKNPYFGSKMMTCGTVQKQIN